MQYKPNSIFEAAASVLSESKIADPKIQKLIATHEAERQKFRDIFNDKQKAIDAIKAKAKQDIAAHKKVQDKATDDALALIKGFSGKMKSLGYDFKALGGWHKI